MASNTSSRFLFALVAAGLAVTAALIQACGGTDEPSAASADAGSDAASEAAAAVPGEDAGTCDPSSDFRTKIPDAAIADGASSSGACVACASEKCPANVSACNLSCDCKNLAATGLDGYLKNTTNPAACAALFITGDVSEQAKSIGIALFTCFNRSCEVACATQVAGDGGR